VQRTAVGGPAAAADPGATPVIGDDRYSTAVKLAESAFVMPKVIGLASGATFADTLSGGTNIAARGGPLLLVPPSGGLPPSVATYLSNHRSTVTSGLVFGGALAVADAVVAAAQTLLRAP
jgi:hypothetical protein